MWISWATRMWASFGAFFLWLITLVYFTQDITLGVSLGSATQISMFVVPLCIMVAWITGIKMDLDLNLLETGSLIMAILVIAFTLQDGTSHYLKGLVPLLCYLAIGACFFVFKSPLE
ncbi:hypothetical protein ZIOFF_012866 [Zingiber officinale]|uniref:Sodium/calcium exchanger membrane region domain-containing protein n=1 Tax=Zingiber officinale TaxID=94328 RepID=A0A8J5HU50_ZINOF|nr:hypothetical protein ZIOFF_012866 [Zingiber officinale]